MPSVQVDRTNCILKHIHLVHNVIDNKKNCSLLCFNDVHNLFHVKNCIGWRPFAQHGSWPLVAWPNPPNGCYLIHFVYNITNMLYKTL